LFSKQRTLWGENNSVGTIVIGMKSFTKSGAKVSQVIIILSGASIKMEVPVKEVPRSRKRNQKA